jgi:hypothetical protein
MAQGGPSTAGEDRPVLDRVGKQEHAHEVDPAVKTPKLTPLRGALHLPPSQAGPPELCDRHDAVLTPRNLDYPATSRTESTHVVR